MGATQWKRSSGMLPTLENGQKRWGHQHQPTSLLAGLRIEIQPPPTPPLHGPLTMIGVTMKPYDVQDFWWAIGPHYSWSFFWIGVGLVAILAMIVMLCVHLFETISNPKSTFGSKASIVVLMVFIAGCVFCWLNSSSPLK